MKDEEIIKEESVMSDDSHKKKEKNKRILLYVLKKHKVGILIVILMIMLSSTFAWFIFNRTVDMELQAKVKAWNIVLGDTTTSDAHTFVVEDLYPGVVSDDNNIMNTVSIENGGEVAATIKVRIDSIKLFGENYGSVACVTDESLATGDLKCIITTDENGTIYSIEGFPFSLTFTLSSETVEPNAKASLLFRLLWEYERDDDYCFIDEDGNQTTTNYCDIEDTLFGEKSYEFNSNPDNDGQKSLEINLQLDITQAN